jgi:hypothetical protein
MRLRDAKTMIRTLAVLLAAVLLGAAPAVRAQAAASSGDAGTCGKVVTIGTHDRTTTRYAFLPPTADAVPAVTLILLAGGSGHVDLDARGCPRALRGNSLVRSIPLFGKAGFGTALVDARSDHQGEDGLAGFRTEPAHADDLGRIVADLRTRTGGGVWIVGTSRGTISAVNAAARLTGSQAADGIVLTSALTVGDPSARRRWVAQSVFDLPLESIRVPVLVVGHADDTCVRSPASRAQSIVDRTNSTRKQVVTVTGGPGSAGVSSLAACEGRSPHGFLEQESAVADGIARFIRGGAY